MILIEDSGILLKEVLDMDTCCLDVRFYIVIPDLSQRIPIFSVRSTCVKKGS